MKKPDTILTFDTTNASMLTVTLTVDGQEFVQRETTGIQRSTMLLPICNELLRAHAVSWADMTSLQVVNAKGSITGLRVGFAVANALGFLLGIPVNGMNAMKNIHPQYGTVTYLDALDVSYGQK